MSKELHRFTPTIFTLKSSLKFEIRTFLLFLLQSERFLLSSTRIVSVPSRPDIFGFQAMSCQGLERKL